METPNAVPNLVNLPGTNYIISRNGVVTILNLEKYCMKQIGEAKLGRYCAALVNSEDAFIRHHNKVHNRKFAKCQFCEDGQIYYSLLGHWNNCESFKKWKVQNLKNRLLLCEVPVKDEDGNVQMCGHKSESKEQVASHLKTHGKMNEQSTTTCEPENQVKEQSTPVRKPENQAKEQFTPMRKSEGRFFCPVEGCESSFTTKPSLVDHIRKLHKIWCGLDGNRSPTAAVAPHIGTVLLKDYFNLVPSNYKEFQQEFSIGMVDVFGRLGISIQIDSGDKLRSICFNEDLQNVDFSFKVYHKELARHKQLLLPLYDYIEHVQIWKYNKTRKNQAIENAPAKLYHLLLLTRGNDVKSQLFEIKNVADFSKKPIFYHRTTYDKIHRQTGILFSEKCIKPLTWSNVDTTLQEVITQFRCSVCLAYFSSSRGLRDHQRTIAPHSSCFVCGKNLCTYNRLRDHLNQFHPDTNFVQCHICARPFSTYKEHQEHVAEHVRRAIAISKGEEKVDIEPSNVLRQCEKCGQMFGNPAKLKKHERSKSTCGCGLVFCTKYYLAQHSMLDH